MLCRALISLFLTSTALATTWTVDDDGKADFDNIQAAVDAASDGDEIIVAPGTYTSTASEVIDMRGKEIWLHSSAGAEVTIIDGEETRRGITCVNGESLNTIIEGFTITGGYANNAGGGGMLNYVSSPTLTNCTFENNSALGEGGGMLNANSNPTLTNCTFENNSAYDGGGMYNEGSSPTLTNCTFAGNTANDDGGGVYNEYESNPVLENCTITGNTASYGGGMNNSNSSSSILIDSLICGNTPDQLFGYFINGGGNTIAYECPLCLADVNDDRIVDISDILAVIGAWGMCACEEMPNPVGSILDKYLSNDLRVLTWNVEHANAGTLSFHPATMTELELAPFIRVLKAIDADVIVFNEIESDDDVKALPEWLHDHVRSGIWQVHQGIDTGDRTVIASYYPMNMLATNTDPQAWTGRGVTMALIDCPDPCWSTDLYLLGVHLKAFNDPEDEEKRQESADAIANWLGDLRTVGDCIDLPQDTPMVVLGDMNFYGEGDQPELTILTGDIQNEDYYGPDIKGDWDGSDLIDPIPADPITGDTWTSWGWKSRPDRFMVTDSVLNIGNAYILNTTELPQDELDANGLQEYDTANIPTSTSDHLPVVVDFRDPNYCRADLNSDGIVDVSDLLLVISNWGACP